MHLNFLIRALPAVMAGAALFFSGCAGLRPVDRPPPAVVEAEAHYRAGLEFLRDGLSDRALESFSLTVVTHPSGWTAPAAMHRIAEVHRDREDDRAALAWLQRLEEGFPGYREADQARLLKVEVLASAGEPERALAEGASWAEANRDHRLYPEMCAVLGDLSLRTGDMEAGFRWWLEAHEAGREDPVLRGRAEQKLDELAEDMDVVDLARVADLAAGTAVAPRIYQRMAEGYLSIGDMERAEAAALSLVRSSPEDEWVSLGKDILDRIREQLSVRGNLVGCILPQSGPFAVYGQELLRGIHLGLAMEAVLYGSDRSIPDIEVVIEDSAGEPGVAEAALLRLATEEKVIAVVGPLSSNAAEVVGEKSQRLGIPLIAVTQREEITASGDMVFRNFIYPSREVKRLLDGAMGPLGMERFAVLYPDNPYGRHFRMLFQDAVEERGGTITAVTGYEPGTTDFAEPIKELTGLASPGSRRAEAQLPAGWPAEREEMEAHPDGPQPVVDFDAIFIPDASDGIAMLAPQLLYHDVTGVVLMGTSLWQSPRLLEQAANHIQGAIFAAGFFAESTRSGNSSFVETYRRWFGTEPGVLAATGYDTIRFLSGLLAGMDVPTRISLRAAIAESAPFAGVTGDISFDETGEVEKEPFLLMVHGRGFIEF